MYWLAGLFCDGGAMDGEDKLSRRSTLLDPLWWFCRPLKRKRPAASYVIDSQRSAGDPLIKALDLFPFSSSTDGADRDLSDCKTYRLRYLGLQTNLTNSFTHFQPNRLENRTNSGLATDTVLGQHLASPPK